MSSARLGKIKKKHLALCFYVLPSCSFFRGKLQIAVISDGELAVIRACLLLSCQRPASLCLFLFFFPHWSACCSASLNCCFSIRTVLLLLLGCEIGLEHLKLHLCSLREKRHFLCWWEQLSSSSSSSSELASS